MRLYNIHILTLMELKKLWYDKLEFLILVFGAIALCFIFGYVAYDNPKNIDVAVFTDQYKKTDLFKHRETEAIINDIDESAIFSVTETYSLEQAMLRLNSQKSRAVLLFQEDDDGLARVKIYLDGTEQAIQQLVGSELPKIIRARSNEASVEALVSRGIPRELSQEVIYPVSLDITTNEWQKTKFFDTTASPFIVLIILGVCLLTSVTAITSERSIGTFERILATPFNISEVIISKTVARSVLALFVSIIIVISLKLFFDITMGSPALVILTAVLVGISGVTFGLLISSVTRVELESVALGIMFWFLYMTLMGFMWPPESMHPLFQMIATLTPYYHGVFAVRHINIIGWGLNLIYPLLLIIFMFIIVQTVLSIFLLKRDVQ